MILFSYAGLIYDALLSYNTAFYICGVTTALSSILMFFIPWLTSKNKGRRFQRDSVDSRMDSLMSTALSRTSRSISFRAGGTTQEDSRSDKEKASECKSGSSKNSSEEQVNDLDEEYLYNYEENEENIDISLSWTDLSFNTSKNTNFNSSMSHRGSVARVLLSHQLSFVSSRSGSPINNNSALGSSRNHSPCSMQIPVLMKTEKYDDKIEKVAKVESVV